MGSSGSLSTWVYKAEPRFWVSYRIKKFVERKTRKTAEADRSFLGRLLVQGKKGNPAEMRESVPAPTAKMLKMHSYFHSKEPAYDSIKLAA